jgi:hypothetical protein
MLAGSVFVAGRVRRWCFCWLVLGVLRMVMVLLVMLSTIMSHAMVGGLFEGDGNIAIAGWRYRLMHRRSKSWTDNKVDYQHQAQYPQIVQTAQVAHL